jgi:hypothetical protein
MNEAFSEIRRVLKPNGFVLITFHSTSFEIRNALIEAVMESGLELRQILHQMPPRMSVKSLLHYQGSPTGDYYIRFQKISSNVDNSIPSKNQVKIKSPEVIEHHIQTIVSKILASRGEPTAEIWLTNLIDTFLCYDNMFPLHNFENYLENIRKSGLFTISKDKYWWFSNLSRPDHIERPLSDRVQVFFEEIHKRTLEQGIKFNNSHSTPQQYFFNEIYRHFRGVNTPDKYQINHLIENYQIKNPTNKKKKNYSN